MGQPFGFQAEWLDVSIRQLSVEDFDGYLSFQVDVLAQVDLSETTPPKQTDQAIVAQLLPDAISHHWPSSGASMGESS